MSMICVLRCRQCAHCAMLHRACGGGRAALMLPLNRALGPLQHILLVTNCLRRNIPLGGDLRAVCINTGRTRLRLMLWERTCVGLLRRRMWRARVISRVTRWLRGIHVCCSKGGLAGWKLIVWCITRIAHVAKCFGSTTACVCGTIGTTTATPVVVWCRRPPAPLPAIGLSRIGCIFCGQRRNCGKRLRMRTRRLRRGDRGGRRRVPRISLLVLRCRVLLVGVVVRAVVIRHYDEQRKVAGMRPRRHGKSLA
jgi:hypothetical protein